MQWLAVFVGGGVGSLLRFGVAQLSFYMPIQFPWGTLFANIISSFIFGFVIGLSFGKIQVSPLLKLFFVTGLCGGFSTFSTFSMETFQLFEKGSYLLGGGNVLLNLLSCLIAIGAGLALGRNI